MKKDYPKEVLEMYDGWEKDNWYLKSKKHLIKQFLVKDSKRKTILDLGAGIGLYNQILNEYGNVYSAENSQNAINYMKKNNITNIKKTSAVNLNYKSNKFDYVLCTEVLEHIGNDEKAIKEITRVLKPGGIAIITVPALMQLWTRDDDSVQHKRRYEMTKLKEKIQKYMKIKYASYKYTLIFPAVILLTIYKNLKTVFGLKQSNMISIKFPTVINDMIMLIMKIENNLLKTGISMPIGSSIIMIVQKRKRKWK